MAPTIKILKGYLPITYLSYVKIKNLKNFIINNNKDSDKCYKHCQTAEFVDLPEDEVKELLCRASQPLSLEMKIGDGDETVLLDLLAGDETLPAEKVEMNCMKGDLNTLLQQLPGLFRVRVLLHLQ